MPALVTLVTAVGCRHQVEDACALTATQSSCFSVCMLCRVMMSSSLLLECLMETSCKGCATTVEVLPQARWSCGHAVGQVRGCGFPVGVDDPSHRCKLSRVHFYSQSTKEIG
eukprot:1151406-Pelagomonas_calceolata.AAC.5